MFYLTLIEGEESQEKFTVIYYKWRDLMLHTANKILHDEQLSEDAVHDAFMYIARNIHKIDDPNSRSAKAYLLLVTDSCAKKIFRSQKEIVSAPLVTIHANNDEPVEVSYFEAYDISKLKDAVASLPEEYRTPLLLKYAGGYKSAEIAGIMGIKPDAVRKRQERAKRMLRMILEEEEETIH